MKRPSRFRVALARRSRAALRADVDAELRFHLEERIEELVEQGVPRARAEAEVRARFGDVAGVRAECEAIDAAAERRRSRRERLGDLARELRLAARALLRRPAFTLVAVGTLALGSGAATTVFGVVNGVLLRPLPYPEPERLVSVSHTLAISGLSKVDQSDAGFLLYQRSATAFEGMGVHRISDVNLGAADGAGAPERVAATGVSAGLFDVLRVAPLLGRGFLAAEDRPGGPRVVVLSERLWRRQFGADPRVVGRRVIVDGAPREVVGVMPARFQYPNARTELWFPLALDPARANPGSFNYVSVARLKPGVAPSRAASELAGILPRVVDEFPSDVTRGMLEQVRLRPAVAPLRDVLVGDVRRLLWILLGSAALLLLVACANAASLFLVRAEGAQREVAVRTALGAGRGAIVSRGLAEALLIAGAGGAVGVALALVAARLLRALPAGLDIPRLGEVSVDGRVVGFAVAVTAFATLAVSVLPLLRTRRLPVAVVLKDAGRSATAGARRQRARSALVVAQVALALVLVAGSGLMARSFARLRDVRPGFDAERVLTLRVALPRATYRDAAAVTQLYDRLLAQVRALPGVTTAGLTTWVPLTSNHDDTTISVEDRPLPENVVPDLHYIAYVSGELFSTMGIPLLAGRTFAPADAARPSTDVIVTRAFAERYWKGSSPLGKRIRPFGPGPWYTIVGVVGDVHLEALEKPAEDAVYFPIATPNGKAAYAPGTIALMVRTTGNPEALVAPVRRVVQRLDPALPTYDERPLRDVLSAAAARTRFVMLVLALASAVALTLGAVGVYGVMAYGVSLRQREIGVRMALGARPADVGQMISRHGVALAAAGVGLGLAAALGVTRFLRGLLYDVSPTDPVTLGGTCAVLLLVALVASWLPARRAAAMDPVEALRRE
jgi:putative ABC transport system permease protein